MQQRHALGLLFVLLAYGLLSGAGTDLFGDRLGTIASHVPTYTVFVDRPSAIAEIWPIVDEITAEHGVVTAAFAMVSVKFEDQMKESNFQEGFWPTG